MFIVLAKCIETSPVLPSFFLHMTSAFKLMLLTYNQCEDCNVYVFGSIICYTLYFQIKYVDNFNFQQIYMCVYMHVVICFLCFMYYQSTEDEYFAKKRPQIPTMLLQSRYACMYVYIYILKKQPAMLHSYNCSLCILNPFFY
jgi:hypothetical protein